MSKTTAEAGARLLTALTTLTNMALGGHLPEFALPVFFGASLIAMQNKDDDISRASSGKNTW